LEVKTHVGVRTYLHYINRGQCLCMAAMLQVIWKPLIFTIEEHHTSAIWFKEHTLLFLI